jgi:hypothetical protein
VISQPHDQTGSTDEHSSWPEHLRPRAAARYLAVSKAFLDQARVNGTGPRFARISRTLVLYRKTDLDNWLRSHLAFSTSEPKRAENT